MQAHLDCGQLSPGDRSANEPASKKTKPLKEGGVRSDAATWQGYVNTSTCSSSAAANMIVPSRLKLFISLHQKTGEPDIRPAEVQPAGSPRREPGCPHRHESLPAFELNQILLSAQDSLQIFLCRGNGFDVEILYQHSQYVGRDECRQRRPQTDIPDAQVKQRQQNRHGLLLIPGEDH